MPNDIAAASFGAFDESAANEVFASGTVIFAALSFGGWFFKFG